MSLHEFLVVSFYSYKGGTGRTTATANIATILAKKGLKVVCIDMDLEGPGLSVLFNIPEEKERGLQYIFEKPDFQLKSLIVSINNIVNDSISDKVFVIPATTQFNRSLDFSDGSKYIKRIRELFSVINEEIKPNIVILDTPSGYGHLSALSMYLSEVLVIFFRWSRQNLLGTVKIEEFAKENGLEYLLVASCVPDEKGNEERKKRYEKFVQPNFEIKDDNELKWVERIILFEQQGQREKFTSYEGYSLIAERLKQLYESK